MSLLSDALDAILASNLTGDMKQQWSDHLKRYKNKALFIVEVWNRSNAADPPAATASLDDYLTKMFNYKITKQYKPKDETKEPLSLVLSKAECSCTNGEVFLENEFVSLSSIKDVLNDDGLMGS
ncbi:hypothetical protein PPL_11618 [Heterostelium album PN500]|uniref:Uncharacterized protein n=1 Tax=Heterostelium pallidum (strain ATCC 26659 / Pp 5 / PN500) TaxID=670386 RepID=D3BV92_HETP5|nr:hypothetical protein PPL_11618 [Heterostelium album PN500]EFA74649.1 hypothetical protein PPL_11618 [Heterostelium album PN500]|eukprot:XP_020426783.1 hypothetical protein PPL_11618 [Heterostelium album PN500]